MDIIFKPYDSKIELKAGMIVKKDDGDIELVGNINLNEGYCNCCCYGKIVEFNDDLCSQLEPFLTQLS